jgi:hypothetical protein
MAKKTGGKGKGGKGAATEAAPSPRTDRSVCVRRIQNGYVVSESGVRNGQYFTRETFTPRAPKVVIAPTK